MKTLLLILLLFVAGCAMVEIKKPDGTNIFAVVAGSTDLGKLKYKRDPNSIEFGIGEVTNTPAGVGETIGAGIVVGAGL